MANPIKRITLTPAQAAEKELILDQIRVIPKGPWVNGKKVVIPKTKSSMSGNRKKNQS